MSKQTSRKMYVPAPAHLITWDIHFEILIHKSGTVTGLSIFFLYSDLQNQSGFLNFTWLTYISSLKLKQSSRPWYLHRQKAWQPWIWNNVYDVIRNNTFLASNSILVSVLSAKLSTSSSYVFVDVWNSFPDALKTFPTLQSFRSASKTQAHWYQ